MDFNDLTRRINRVYISIGELTLPDYQRNISWDPDPDEFDISFVLENDPRDEVRVTNVIGAIADLKDNLKKKMTHLGLDNRLVEQEIDGSMELQLITDLDNATKHGYPLTRPERSQRSPTIGDVTSSVVIALNGPGGGISFDLETRESIISGGADGSVEIVADIIDGSKQFICTLDDMVNVAMDKWESFIRLHGLN